MPVAQSTMQSFDETYRRESGRIKSALHRFGVAREDLDEGLHEVFLIAWRRREDVGCELDLTAWLCGIAKGYSWNYRRALRRRARLFLCVEVSNVPAPQHQLPDERIAQRRELTRALRVLSDVAPERWDAFELTQLTCHSVPEAAHMLGISQQSVRVRIRAVRRALGRHKAAASRRAGL